MLTIYNNEIIIHVGISLVFHGKMFSFVMFASNSSELLQSPHFCGELVDAEPFVSNRIRPRLPDNLNRVQFEIHVVPVLHHSTSDI